MRKYFKTRIEARKALVQRKSKDRFCSDEIFKMPKGTRRAGEYAVCTHLEYLNTY